MDRSLGPHFTIPAGSVIIFVYAATARGDEDLDWTLTFERGLSYASTTAADIFLGFLRSGSLASSPYPHAAYTLPL